MDYIQLLMICLSNLSDKSQPKCEKGPLSHQKMKCSFLDYFQLLMISQAILPMKVNQNAKKDPLSHHKMKCSFLDYVQLLMIGWVIWVIKVNQNAKKGPLSHQNIILIFGLHSTSDDSAEQSEWQKSTKMWKRPPKSSKIKCSFLDYVQLLMICQVILAMKVDQNAKKGPLSHQKIKCSFLDYFQLLMIG